MSLNNFPYTSLHNYLDVALSDIENPSHTQIKESKREYWKLYYTHYRQQKRKTRKEYTLGFDAEGLRQIGLKKESLSVSQYLYQAVEQAISDNRQSFYDKAVLGKIDQHLMHLIDLVEELIASESTALNERVLERIELLERQFFKLLKPIVDDYQRKIH